MTNTPAPDVLRIRVAITDVDPTNTAVNVATSVVAFVPVDMGGAGMETEFIDSVTKERLFAAMEQRKEQPPHALREFIDVSKEQIDAFSHVLHHNPNHVSIRTRSVMGILYLLSQSVEVPQEDVRKGKLTTTKYADGRPFYWSDLFNNLFQIKSSSEKPSDAFVSIKYRGSWFYIDDTDVESKRTYSLFSQIFAIHPGGLVRWRRITNGSLGKHRHRPIFP